MILEGQINGGLTMGLAPALYEEINYDEDGNIQGGSFTDYLLPTAVETPRWETDKTTTPSPHHPLGAKAVGESATVGAPAAIANAVVDALWHLGVRPASARPGMKAIIRPDGTLEGWGGGSCAHPVVVREALRLLHEETPGLIGLSPPGQAGAVRAGLIYYPMTCHSGGSLEIYIEPVLPRPRLLPPGPGPRPTAPAPP